MKRKLSEEEILRIFKNYQTEKKKAQAARDFLYEYFLPLFDEFPFRKILKDDGLRMEAYVEAVERFVHILKGATGTTYEHREKGMIPYFCEIFEKKCIDILRKENRKNKPEIKNTDQSFLQNLSTNNGESIRQQIRKLLDDPLFWKLLYQFKQQYAHCFHVLLLRYVECFSIKETAEILEKKEGTVKVQSSTCVGKLKNFNKKR